MEIVSPALRLRSGKEYALSPRSVNGLATLAPACDLLSKSCRCDSVLLSQPVLHRVERGLGPIFHTQLIEDRADVALDGPLGEI